MRLWMTIPRLLKEIENRKSEIIQLTSELIKIPTVNPPGKNYREISNLSFSAYSNISWHIKYNLNI